MILADFCDFSSRYVKIKQVEKKLLSLYEMKIKTKKFILLLVVAAAAFLVVDYLLQRPWLSAGFSRSEASEENGELEPVQDNYFPFQGFFNAWDFSDIFGGAAGEPRRR